jgi:glycosyltransferase involved in cell wall biosynthesis
VGYVHPGKGQMDAVLAVAALRNQGTSINLKIVGGGRPRYVSKLRKVVAENGIGQRVEFTGFVDDAQSIVEAASMVLVCSRAEAFGRVTVESMVAGTPVIGANSGATPELVKHGFNGLLYEPGNHRELAERMKYLIAHPEEAQRMGRNGLEWASRRFTVERYADEILGVLDKVMGGE